MIMINNYLKYFLIFSVFVLNSCETLQDFAGLNKPDLEIDLFEETPELVLPPDFGKVAKRSKYRNEKIINQTPDFSDNFQQPQYQSIQPRVTNYIAPSINVESSPTPSDSLERFKENKKFTIGQWVYGQYIQGFKQGNLYYRPIYDKGYNFSRRYLPDQNITSFLRPQQQYIENANRRESIPMDSNFQNLENLPIID
tara:strand:+ start:498 stop:1088 length:591 start_codon:yes stop_codon:yes gene_type:complete